MGVSQVKTGTKPRARRSNTCWGLQGRGCTLSRDLQQNWCRAKGSLKNLDLILKAVILLPRTFWLRLFEAILLTSPSFDTGRVWCRNNTYPLIGKKAYLHYQTMQSTLFMVYMILRSGQPERKSVWCIIC